MSTSTQTAETSLFEALTEPLRRELLAHCYRMLGSVTDAEDTVQETYLRAWRGFDRFEGRSSVRTWLYRIATNACLSAIERRGRRALPSDLSAPSSDPLSSPLADDSAAWIQPIPDALITPASDDPAQIVAARQSLRLALVASLQYLPARQRAVLLLREVLAFPAAEVAKILSTTVPAVKSTLQRARARLDEVAPAEHNLYEPDDPRQRQILDRYVQAIENADVEALRGLLDEDLVIEATPNRTWFTGIATCLPFLERHVFGAGSWHLRPTMANGQPATMNYLRGESGVYRAYGVVVLGFSARGINRINAFGEPGLAAIFDLPSSLHHQLA